MTNTKADIDKLKAENATLRETGKLLLKQREDARAMADQLATHLERMEASLREAEAKYDREHRMVISLSSACLAKDAELARRCYSAPKPKARWWQLFCRRG